MKKSIYLTTLSPIIQTVGQKAHKAWLNFDRRQTKLKSQTQIVTAVDQVTEKALVKQIKKHFKDHAFLGEEYGASKKTSNYTWIIDPIDGTTNFSIHNPLWSISVGLAYQGEIIFGMIYAPVLQELFWAEKGRGAYLNGKRLRLTRQNIKNRNGKLIHAFCHGDKKRDLEIALAYYRNQKLNALDCRQLGSAALELAYVASGRIDSLVIPGAKSWDIAAGALIAREAGAVVKDFSGQNWKVSSQDILTCHAEILPDVLKQIKKAYLRK